MTAIKKKRESIKFANLKGSYNPKVRRQYVDYDYVENLTDKEKEFLNKFTGEHYGASFDKNNRKNIHKKKEQKRQLYRENNSRNIDLYSITSIHNLMAELDYAESFSGGENPENRMEKFEELLSIYDDLYNYIIDQNRRELNTPVILKMHKNGLFNFLPEEHPLSVELDRILREESLNTSGDTKNK